MARIEVHRLVVRVGRAPGDGLPEGALGAELLCLSAGASEEAAIGEAVAVLKRAGMAPLEVEAEGTLAERLAAGEEVDAGERALIDQALADNAVVVAAVRVIRD
ncbi:MAG: hypothetical protein D6686_15295 [Alphaproteobacteria bacterium]|nr:MAG: hypothetical protein D6686_15295 [Alphaproteobacteria bacterium]